jgi:iron complex outermembrane recepter protein
LNRECVGYFSVNCSFTGSIQPEFQTSTRATFGVGDVDLSFLWRWIDAVEYEPAEVAAGNGILPQFRNIPAEHYFDLTARWNASDNFSFTFTVQNLLDNKPFVVGNTAGSTSFNSGNVFPSTYDALGRRFGVAAKLTF